MRKPRRIRPPSSSAVFDRLARIIPRQCPVDHRSIDIVICRAGGASPAAKVTYACSHSGIASITEEGPAFAMNSFEVPFS